MIFRIHSESVLGLVVCLVIENSFELYVRTWLLCFLIRRLHRWFLRLDVLEFTSSTTSVTTALQLKFVCVTSFLLSGQLYDLPRLVNSELTYETLIFKYFY